MILQSLNRLYDRLAADPDYEIPPTGYSRQQIAFVVVLRPDGDLFEIQSLRNDKGKGKQLLVPGGDKPPGQITKNSVHKKAGFLRNDSAFLLGRRLTSDDDSPADMELSAFKKAHLELENEIDDPGFSSVCRFLRQWDPDRLTEAQKEITKGGVGVFQIVGETQFVHDRKKVREWWDAKHLADEGEGVEAFCLVTGTFEKIAETHEPQIKGVEGASSTGAPLVSFNRDAFKSYGKDKSYNSPVSKLAAFQYGTALNALTNGPKATRHNVVLRNPKAKLRSEDRKKSTTVVFWTEKPTTVESWIGEIVNGDLAEVQDPESLKKVEVLMQAMRRGAGELLALGDDPATPVHILGIAPNQGRISIRFWHTGSLGELFDKLKAHHDALRIVRQFREGSKRTDPEFPPAWMLLRETARESKDISPLLGGALMRAILEGTPYPDALANALIRRIRADHKINYLRAAMLKAWLTRKPNRQGGIPVSLDTERTNLAYRLGRLFAVLESAQYRALGDVGANIRDRFYSSASATPSVIFPRLLRTYQHHLGKMERGSKTFYEKQAQEIIGGIDTMPAHLNLEAQAQFAIGYYHQRKALFDGAKTSEAQNDNQE